jgi:hypothetical protein
LEDLEILNANFRIINKQVFNISKIRI